MSEPEHSSERVDTLVHEGVDLAALAAKHGLCHWRCRKCGQWDTIKVGENPKPCFRCDINSGAYQRRLEETARLGNERRERERLMKETR